MAEMANAFGSGSTITHKGKTYHVSPLTLGDMGAFEVWLEDAAFRKVERLRGRLDPDAYQGRLDAVARVIGSGAYAYHGKLAQNAARTLDGQRYLLYLMLRQNDGMTEELAAEILDADAAAAAARMNAANDAGGDEGPNSPAPAAA